MEKKIICIVCPIGCEIMVTGEKNSIQEISGHICKRGEIYASDEFLCPKRILTTTVKIDESKIPVISVRSQDPIPKDQMFNCMEILRNTIVSADVKCGDVIVENILDTGVDIIVTRMLS